MPVASPVHYKALLAAAHMVLLDSSELIQNQALPVSQARRPGFAAHLGLGFRVDPKP